MNTLDKLQKLFLLIGCVILVSPNSAEALKLQWDTVINPTPVFYKVYRAAEGESFDYDHPIWEGTATQCTLEDIDPLTNYYFTVRACDVWEQDSEDADPLYYQPDTDWDGLPDAIEITGCTSPTLADTDADGLIDGLEDIDQDGWFDANETDPCDSDTDADGYDDAQEMSAGTDPLSPTSVPTVVCTDPAGVCASCEPSLAHCESTIMDALDFVSLNAPAQTQALVYADAGTYTEGLYVLDHNAILHLYKGTVTLN